MSNYYMAAKSILPAGYYETVVRNAAVTNSIIVVNEDADIIKVRKAADKIGMKLEYDPITIDEYVRIQTSGEKAGTTKA